MLTTGILMGLGGTLAMDVWALALNKGLNQPLPNWGNVGRWVGHLPQGTVFHKDINAVTSIPQETALGWVFHYAVGAIYGVLFLMIAGQEWLVNTAFLPLWVFSIITIAAGWFLLQPGMGLGWAASRTVNPWKARIMGLLAHTVFAIGMWTVAVSL